MQRWFKYKRWMKKMKMTTTTMMTMTKKSKWVEIKAHRLITTITIRIAITVQTETMAIAAKTDVCPTKKTIYWESSDSKRTWVNCSLSTSTKKKLKWSDCTQLNRIQIWPRIKLATPCPLISQVEPLWTVVILRRRRCPRQQISHLLFTQSSLHVQHLNQS